MFTRVKSSDEIQAMREGGRMLATVLQKLKAEVTAGMTTKDIAILAKQELSKLGGQPTILGYYGFPDVICVSVNEEVVHGIPSIRKVIENGDLVSMDFCVSYKGMITDAALTVGIGDVAEKAQRLMDTTYQALMSGIQAVHNGVRVGEIAASIQAVLDQRRYGIVRDLVGHGVGHEMHEDPNIPNYGNRKSGPVLVSGMTIAIEPMATLGDYKVATLPDGWTVQTADGSWAAHYEHTVLITEAGAEILTA